MSKKPNRVVQYKIANEKFLEQKAQEEGIKALESGILIREIEKGSGTRTPQLRSTVYELRFQYLRFQYMVLGPCHTLEEGTMKKYRYIQMD